LRKSTIVMALTAAVSGRFFLAISSLILVASHANAGQFRIVALGASNTAGRGVTPSQAFPAQLEALLRAKGYDVTISNAAVSGYTSRDILGSVNSAVTPGTKVVLVGYGIFNDRRKGLAPAESQADVRAIDSGIRARGAKIIRVNWGRLAPNFYQVDGIHLTAEGHALIARRIVPQVIAALRR
jgi:acyl-CoA thioesterase I